MIPNPDRIVCVGLNYQDHVVETGRDNTEQPAIFLRLPESQVGHRQPIVRPRESTHLDFEAEIAVIIGSAGRRISQKDAYRHIAGYSCYNDGSVRDWQRHTIQWTAGKNFAATGGFGPALVPTGDRSHAADVLNAVDVAIGKDADVQLMVDVAKREDQLLDKISELLAANEVLREELRLAMECALVR